MKHIAKFNNENDIQTALNNGNLVNPYIASYGNNIDYNLKTKKFENIYLTFTALENMQFSYNTHGENQLSYSIDDGETWTEIWPEVEVSLNSGDKIMLKGTLSGEGDYYGVAQFPIQKRFNVEGNVMSIIYGDNFINQTSLAGRQNIFLGLFTNVINGGYASKVVDASNLVLPATTLANNCYGFMFYGCTSLTTAPKLPATTLGAECYGGMFSDCTSLTTAPELPATTLAEYCYSGMFEGCTSLTSAPELPATTLESSCYTRMFYGCTSLTTAPELPATTLAEYCYDGMFSNCRSLTTAPELPATTLAEYCYNSMFADCSNLNYIKCLATSVTATNCTRYWVDGVASTGIFVKAANTDWSGKTGNDGIPSGWTVQDAA